LGKFSVTLDYFYGRPIRMLVDSMRGNPDVIPLPVGDLDRLSNT